MVDAFTLHGADTLPSTNHRRGRRSPRTVTVVNLADTKPSSDSLVKVYGGTGEGEGGSGSGTRRGSNEKSKKNQSKRRGRPSSQNRRNDGGRRSNSNRAAGRANGTSRRIPTRNTAATVRKESKEEQEAFRSKIQEMHDKDANGEELSRELCVYDALIGIALNISYCILLSLHLIKFTCIVYYLNPSPNTPFNRIVLR